MHEGNFTHQIVDAILTATKDHPNGRVRRVKVKVGDMLHLEKESVLAHFESLVKGTPLEEAKLELEEMSTRVQCRHCRNRWQPEDHHFLFCEHCQKSDVDIVSGNEVLIDAIDLDV